MQKIDFEALFRAHYRALCMYALHRVGDIEVSEDIVMDCFVKLDESIQQGQVILSVKSYLYRMVSNACVDYQRKEAVLEYPLEFPECPDDSEELHAQCEREANLWKAIDSLPKVCRTVLLMSKCNGLKNKEIAEKLGISIKTVEAHLTKAYALLRKDAESFMLYMLLL